jgi:hypothetical protein
LEEYGTQIVRGFEMGGVLAQESPVHLCGLVELSGSLKIDRPVKVRTWRVTHLAPTATRPVRRASARSTAARQSYVGFAGRFRKTELREYAPR